MPVNIKELPLPTMNGAKLLKLRTEMGATQLDLACALGITPQTIMRYELDRAAIPVSIMYAVVYIHRHVLAKNLVNMGKTAKESTLP